jgi:hypothetical protein
MITGLEAGTYTSFHYEEQGEQTVNNNHPILLLNWYKFVDTFVDYGVRFTNKWKSLKQFGLNVA